MSGQRVGTSRVMVLPVRVFTKICIVPAQLSTLVTNSCTLDNDTARYDRALANVHPSKPMQHPVSGFNARAPTSPLSSPPSWWQQSNQNSAPDPWDICRIPTYACRSKRHRMPRASSTIGHPPRTVVDTFPTSCTADPRLALITPA